MRSQEPKRNLQTSDMEVFRISKFQIWHLLVLMFSFGCFISFARLSWAAGRGEYTSIEFILGMLGVVGFPIGIGTLNRGGFLTMVFSFFVAILLAVVTFKLSRDGF